LTTRDDSPDHLQLREWQLVAWYCLGCVADTPRTTIQQQFLRELHQADGVLDTRRQLCYEILLLPVDLRVPPALLRDAYEQQCREDLQKLSDEVLDLPLLEREARFESLMYRSRGIPQLEKRIRALRNCLQVGTRFVTDHRPDVAELGRQLVRLRLLPPTQQINARIRLLRQWSAEPARWRNAARIFKRQYRSEAALDRGLIDLVAKSQWEKTDWVAELTARLPPTGYVPEWNPTTLESPQYRREKLAQNLTRVVLLGVGLFLVLSCVLFIGYDFAKGLYRWLFAGN